MGVSETGDIWAGVFETAAPNSTDGVVPFFEEQCEEIKRGSGGRVQGRFRKLEIVERQTGVGGLALAMQASLTVGETVREEKDSLKQEDANDIYEPSDYVFDVFSDKYKFRILTMKLGMVYPVRFELDDGITKEVEDRLGGYSDNAGRCKGFCLQSDNDLADMMRLVVSHSRKLRSILSMMASGQ